MDPELRKRLKVETAQRGVTIQDFVSGLIVRELGEARQPSRNAKG